jgi:hypothetical protein
LSSPILCRDKNLNRESLNHREKQPSLDISPQRSFAELSGLDNSLLLNQSNPFSAKGKLSDLKSSMKVILNSINGTGDGNKKDRLTPKKSDISINSKVGSKAGTRVLSPEKPKRNYLEPATTYGAILPGKKQQESRTLIKIKPNSSSNKEVQYKAMNKQTNKERNIDNSSMRMSRMSSEHSMKESEDNISIKQRRNGQPSEQLKRLIEIKKVERMFAESGVEEIRKTIVQATQERDQDEQMREQKNLEEFYASSQHYVEYYNGEYGKEITNIPERCKDSPDYLQQDPVTIVQHLPIFDLGLEETHLYWTVRFYFLLKLPAEFERIVVLQNGASHTKYMQRITFFVTDIHPGYFYIKELIRKGRTLNKLAKHEGEQFKERIQSFLDQFGRHKQVDLYQLALMINGDKELYQSYWSVKRSEKNLNTLIKEILKNKEEAVQPLKSVEDRKKAAISNVKDLLVLEVCRQAQVDNQANPHEMGWVTEFLLEKEHDLVWEWRSPDNSKIFWVNQIEKKAQADYPFLKELKERIIKNKQNALKGLGEESNFKNLSKLNFFFIEKTAQEMKRRIQEQRTNYTEIVLAQKLKNFDSLKQYRAEHQAEEEELKRSRLKASQAANEDNVSQRSNNLSIRKSVMSFSSVSRLPRMSPPKDTKKSAFTQYFEKRTFEKKEEEEMRRTIKAKLDLKDLRDCFGRDLIVPFL